MRYGELSIYGSGVPFGDGDLQLQNAKQFLLSMQVNNGWAGDRLMQGYAPNLNAPARGVIVQNSYAWSNAWSVIAFAVSGRAAEASTLLTALGAIQEVSGVITKTYNIVSGAKDGVYKNTFTALMGYAAGIYQQLTSDTSHQSFMTACADRLVSDQQADGSIQELTTTNLYITLTQVLSYFCLRETYRLTGTGGYLTAADNVSAYILANSFNNEQFNLTSDDVTCSLVTQLLGTWFYYATGNKNLVKPYIFSTLNKFYYEAGGGVDAYFKDFGITPELTYLDGTLAGSMLYHRVGDNALTLAYLGTAESHQAAYPPFTGAVQHSSNERLDFYTYYSTAATALYIIAKYYINDTVITGLLFNDN